MAQTREQRNKKRLEWYYKNRERQIAKAKEYNRIHAKEQAALTRERAQKRRIAALDAYGKVCQCCGEPEKEFLVLDHIDNNGKEHRTTIGSGNRWYLWLEKNHYPPGLQVLCCNCNWAKQAYGVCPHTRLVQPGSTSA